MCQYSEVSSPFRDAAGSRLTILTNFGIMRRDVLKEGGKAVDAIIAAMLCDGVTMPQSMGIGGGFFMTIYEKSKGKVSTINAREAAPDAASLNMYHSDSNLAKEGRCRTCMWSPAGTLRAN